jgi:uncharacterized membrane protein (UPF0127 family)
MRFAIDVAMLRRDGVVLEIWPSVKPWRTVVGPADTHAVLETVEAAISTMAVKGDKLEVATNDGRSPAIHFLSTD